MKRLPNSQINARYLEGLPPKAMNTTVKFIEENSEEIAEGLPSLRPISETPSWQARAHQVYAHVSCLSEGAWKDTKWSIVKLISSQLLFIVVGPGRLYGQRLRNDSEVRYPEKKKERSVPSRSLRLTEQRGADTAQHLQPIIILVRFSLEQRLRRHAKDMILLKATCRAK